jgi:polyisoprenoid-binding protein YceI
MPLANFALRHVSVARWWLRNELKEGMTMKRRHALITTFIIAMAVVTALPARSAVAQTAYEIDGVHSGVLFAAKHFGAAWTYGRFNEVSGTFSADPATGAPQSVELTILTQSIDTANKKRDDHLRSPDFFNARQFPQILFRSTEIEKKSDDVYTVKGSITLRGITRPIEFDVKFTGSGKNPRGTGLLGYHATFSIQRSEFGMEFMVGPLSDEVRIIVSLEGMQK